MPFATVSRDCLASASCLMRHLTAPDLLAVKQFHDSPPSFRPPHMTGGLERGRCQQAHLSSTNECHAHVSDWTTEARKPLPPP